MLERGTQAGVHRIECMERYTWTARGGSRDGPEVATLTGSPIRIISVVRCARECSTERHRAKIACCRGQSCNQAYWSVVVPEFSRFSRCESHWVTFAAVATRRIAIRRVNSLRWNNAPRTSRIFCPKIAQYLLSFKQIINLVLLCDIIPTSSKRQRRIVHGYGPQSVASATWLKPIWRDYSRLTSLSSFTFFSRLPPVSFPR